MNREIKFRAWDSEENKMMPVTMINFRDGLIQVDEGDNTITDDFDMFKLMQCSGMIDRNGNEIYEGDIVEMFGSKSFRGIIVFEDKGFGKTDGMQSKTVSHYDAKFYEMDSYIIGNIYENPELL